MVLELLRRLRPELEARGVRHMWVFGSVARGMTCPDSDVDLLVEFDPDTRVSLTAVASLRDELSTYLGRGVDLGEWRTLRPELVTRARADAVEAF